jgi:hypothetical protein
VTQYLREELYWNLGDFVRALAGAQGSVNTRRKATFAEAAYQDSNVLKTFLGDWTRQWTATSRKHIIEQLSIGSIELREEIRKLGGLKPFYKSKVTLTNCEGFLVKSGTIDQG